MTRIRDRGKKRGPRRGRPILPPVMHCDGTTIRPDAAGNYYVPPGHYRWDRVTFDRPHGKGKSFSLVRP